MTNEENDIPDFPWTLSEATYNKLKWLVMVLLPAFSTLYFTLSVPLNLPSVEAVLGSCAAFATFFGVLLKKSGSNFAKSPERFAGELNVSQVNEQGALMYSLDNVDLDAVAVKALEKSGEITLKVGSLPPPQG